jgi:hypothetical protein
MCQLFYGGFIMCDNTTSKDLGTVLLTFLAGAVLGAGVALFVAARHEDDDQKNYDEADLFV